MSGNRRLAYIVLATLLAGAGWWSGALHSAPVDTKPSSDAKPAAEVNPPQAKPPLAKTTAKPGAKSDDHYELYKVLADTIDQVERNYVQDISRRELFEAAVEGILRKLDPYSSYIPPDDIDRFRTGVESEFGGIGIQVGVEDGRLVVLSPLVGSPAYRAGVQAGDRIVEIAGKPTADLSVDEAVKRLKGPAGSSVTFTTHRPATGERVTLNVTREVVHVDTVLGAARNDDDSWNYLLDVPRGIGYIRVTAFSRDTAQEIRAAVEKLQKQKFKGLVLDLRFNPGGLLSAAVEVSDLFLAKGVIVSTQGRNTPKQTWEAKQPGTLPDFPLAVLVNRYSASASEIVAASLQDHGRAVIIGDRTWGKGSVQNVIELEGGKSALKLTTASYIRPNGHNIHRFPSAKETDEWGVKPSEGYAVPLSDMEVMKLLQDFRHRDIARNTPTKSPAPKTTTPNTPEARPQNSDPRTPLPLDRQLHKATDYVTGKKR